MRIISRILFTLMRFQGLAVAFVESPLCVPVATAAIVSSLLVMAKAFALWSPSWMLLGSASAALTVATLLVGQRRASAIKAEEEAARKAIERNRSRGYTRTRCALAYKIGTEPRGKSK